MNDFIYALDDGYDFDQPAQMIVTSTTFMSTAFNYIGSLSHESMALVAESLFQNITLGLLSSDTYTTNASTTPSIPVSVVHAHNIYFYSPHDLFLAYGLAIVAKLIAVTLASIAIWRQGLSYSTDFSSILRATRDLRLHRVLGSGEDANWSSSGADPTSKEIQEMLLVYQSRTGEKWAGFAPFVDTASRKWAWNDGEEEASWDGDSTGMSLILFKTHPPNFEPIFLHSWGGVSARTVA